MPQPFEITQPVTVLNLDANGRAEIEFTVTNVSGGPLRAELRVVPETPADATWFTRDGEPEILLQPMATQQVHVRVAVPPKTASGTYRFRLEVYDAMHPNDNFTTGSTIGFTVAGKAAGKPFPLWIVAVAVAVVLVAGGIFALRPLFGSRETVPDVSGRTSADATAFLTGRGFTVSCCTQTPQTSPSQTVGTIVAQNPAAGTPVKTKPMTVALTAVGETVTVPAIDSSMTFDQAVSALALAHLLPKQYCSTATPTGTIPPAGTAVVAGSYVTITHAGAWCFHPLTGIQLNVVPTDLIKQNESLNRRVLATPAPASQ